MCRQGRRILIKILVPLAALLGAFLKMLVARGVSSDNFHFGDFSFGNVPADFNECLSCKFVLFLLEKSYGTS